MSEPETPSSPPSFQERYTQLREVIERPPEQRPETESIEAIAEWLVGPARQMTSGAAVFDEFCWRLLAAGLPLLRATMHGGTLHPLYLGAALIWWRTTGRTEFRMITHNVRETFAYNPIWRVRVKGELVRRNLEAAPDTFDFPVLHDLREAGATDYLALPVASAFGSHYAVIFVADRTGGFTDDDVANMTRLAGLLPVVMDMHSLRAIASDLLTAYLGPMTGPRVLAGHIRRGQSDTITAVLCSPTCAGSPHGPTACRASA
jgi:adenylate cyclase